MQRALQRCRWKGRRARVYSLCQIQAYCMSQHSSVQDAAETEQRSHHCCCGVGSGTGRQPMALPSKHCCRTLASSGTKEVCVLEDDLPQMQKAGSMAETGHEEFIEEGQGLHPLRPPHPRIQQRSFGTGLFFFSFFFKERKKQ